MTAITETSGSVLDMPLSQILELGKKEKWEWEFLELILKIKEVQYLEEIRDALRVLKER